MFSRAICLLKVILLLFWVKYGPLKPKKRSPEFSDPLGLSRGGGHCNGDVITAQIKYYFLNYYFDHGVVAYRWTQNDVKSSKMYISIKRGTENFELGPKIGQIGPRLTNICSLLQIVLLMT